MPIHTYIHIYLINHRHSRSPLLLPLLSTLSALCVVAAHFILILVLRLFRNNRNIRCDRDVDCAAYCAAAVVSDLASIFLYLSLRCRLLLLLLVLCVGNFVAVFATISYLYSII